ncbi:DNA double-strand break repair nuclease NurA [Candidatus Bathyarchaeota archaeon]|nr:MAG: DNA double-strand break repair nuclease NurA [Candidatus Bathyarchaeota archaeon]RLG96545.1 MAG: hypothetical protein DRO28_05435 [Candidatus Bathyarchaeota archaeon]
MNVVHRTNIDMMDTKISNLRKDSLIYPRLCLALRNLILNEVTRDTHECILNLPGMLDRVKREVRFHKVMKRCAYGSVVGVDAGSQRIPLASYWFAVIAALAFKVPEAKRFFCSPESVKMSYDVSGDKFHEIVSVRRETILFRTARKFLLEDSADLVLIDGPLAFGNWWVMKGEERDRESLIRSVNSFLKLCEERRVAVAGVVKRATARYLVNELGIGRETSLSDAFLLLQTMSFGERTETFSPSKILRKFFHKAPFMDKIAYPIYSFYIRLSPNPLVSPVRIDIPEFMVDQVDDIAGYCLYSAVCDGIPLPIVKADEEVRITKRFVREVYSELVPRMERIFGSASLAAAIWGEFK